jgi:uncharacterized protein (DUF1501 family)
MTNESLRANRPSRRQLLRAGLSGLGVAGMPALFRSTARAAEPGGSGRILVVVELSGANDGLNTVVPYTDDGYYRARPTLAIRPDKLRKIDDRFGFPFTMAGFERLYKDGHLAIVQGVGYQQPSFSHFTSMAFWHTGAPNSGETYGWLGRLADSLDPGGSADYLVNIAAQQSLAVHAARHVPLVFDDPNRFTRTADVAEQAALLKIAAPHEAHNPAEAFMLDVGRSAQTAEARLREAWTHYRTPVDYGLVRFGLERVAALIAAGFQTRIYYVAFANNVFDTHVYQADVHARLLTYTSDHIAAFVRDVERLGRGDDVAVMVFSEFGRRVAENTSAGTDHGTAGPVFVAGKGVRGGHYGDTPGLSDLDDGNMRYTTDFRRVYTSMITEWMGHPDAKSVLKGDFAPLGLFPS